MKVLFRFLLLVGYVSAVLMVTTVEVKAYIGRTEEASAEGQYTASAMDNNVMPVVEDAADSEGGYRDIYEEGNTDTDIAEGGDEAQDTDKEDTDVSEDTGMPEDTEGAGMPGDSENPEGTEETAMPGDAENPEDADMPEDAEEAELIDLFYKWRGVVTKFAMDFDKRAKTSYEVTLEINQADKKCIMENRYDFSNMKLACLGDSVTAASNLDNEENYEQYSYPARLKELLGAEEVYNLGIGGSSIGRYWLEPFVERYTEIPEDTDVIIIMGGYNDGFSASATEFGSLDERAYNTFCGDLDELMRGLKENYPEALVYFATPMACSLHTTLMGKNEKLLPQEAYVQAIGALAEEYGFEFLDLYNLDFLNSHDMDVINEYIPDGTHGNHAGYQVLAERFAAEIVKHFNVATEAVEQSMAETENYESGLSAVQ